MGATAESAAAGAQRVVLFGGQGSQGLISASLAKNTLELTKSSATAVILLSRCHAAFLEELIELKSQVGHELDINPNDFHNVNELLFPRSRYHTHGILESSLICLYQLLHYLIQVEKEGGSIESSFDNLSDTAGLCSGMIPAMVIASAHDEEAFLRFGVGAFRLAFWVGWRAFIEGKKVSKSTAKDDTMSLFISGLSRDQVEKQIDEFYGASRRLCRVSVITGPTTVSISGPPQDLNELKSKLTASTTTFAYVHAWYHGGDYLETAVRDIVKDVQSRSIIIPSLDEVQKPLRSTVDGSLFNSKSIEEAEFLPWLVRHLLVHCVDWRATSKQIRESITERIQKNPNQSTHVVSIGPSTGTIISEIKEVFTHPNVELLDFSPFKPDLTDASLEARSGDIAIVGMGMNLPGGSTDSQKLWEMLSQGLTTVDEIPDSRFNISDYHNKDGTTKGRKMGTKFGSFIDDPWTFDSQFFSISPREAMSMDPQQRILLHTTQAAMDDAGYVRDATPTSQRDSTGCYIGLATGDYTDNLRDSIDVFYSPGTLRAFHSGRLSYVYKMSGPSITIDTACSSSTVSIHQACQALNNGDCSSAIAGGVNVICSPDMYLGLAHGHFLSTTGGCKPFDEGADGYCRAEGCVIFVMKRLSDALAENDRIHAVIRGTHINQSGNAHSITHPHSETQVLLYQELLRRTGVDPRSVSVVEAHGTGTQAGDVREIASLDAVFGKYHSKSNPLAVSSIKGSIGHCEAASGAASLAKLITMIKNKELLPQAGLKSLNPRLDALNEGRLLVPREKMAWQQKGTAPRRALLNNFGAAGSNAAILLEEYCPPRNAVENREVRSAWPFAISAKSRDALKSMVESIKQFLDTNGDSVSLQDICYTATARREIFDYRLSMPCTSIDDLKTQLDRVDTSKVSQAAPKKDLVFVFSGQGSIHVGMGKELMTSSVFKKHITRCDQIVQDYGFGSVIDFITSTTDDYPFKSDSTEYMIISQCACVALEYSLAQMLLSYGLKPDCMIGHSLGEYTALAISNALTLEDTLKIVAFRVKLMTEKCAIATSGMLAVKASSFKAEDVIAENKQLDQLTVACRNSGDDCVVSGPLTQLADLEKVLAEQKIKKKLLNVPFGYHSPAINPIAGSLKELCDSITCLPLKIPIVSSAYGRFFEDSDLGPDYFARHATGPVRFTDAVGEMRSHSIFTDSVCLEIGPHPTTLPMVRPVLNSTECLCIPTLQAEKPAWSTLSSAFSQLFQNKDNISWRDVYTMTGAKTIDFPGYPLAGSSFAKPYVEAPSTSDAALPDVPVQDNLTGYDLIPTLPTGENSDGYARFQTSMATLGALVSGHNVGGTAICPASVYYEVALEGAHALLGLSDGQSLFLEKMVFASPLIHDPSNESMPVYLNLESEPVGGCVQFNVTTKATSGTGETTHCSGVLIIKDSKDVKPTWLKEAAIVKRQQNYLSSNNNETLSTFQTKVLYEHVFTRVVEYAAPYHTLDYLSVSTSSMEGIGKFSLPEATKVEGYVCPPALSDTLLHAAGFIANLAAKPNEIYVCGHVESIEVLYSDIDFSEAFTVYCSLFDVVKGTTTSDAWAMNKDGEIVAVARGCQFKKLQLASFQRMIAMNSGSHSTPATQATSTTAQNNLPAAAPAVNTAAQEAQSSPKSSKPNVLAEFRANLGRMMAEVSGFKEEDLDFDGQLVALGVDSLMEIELASKLKDAYPGHDIDHTRFAECDTLRDIERIMIASLNLSADDDDEADTQSKQGGTSIAGDNEYTPHSPQSSQTSVSEEVSNNPVTLYEANNSNTPLCLFHDGSGVAQPYKKLQGFDRTTYAFQDPHFVDSAPEFSTLEEMAANYAQKIVSLKLKSVILCGWSFGGVVAYEAAQRLSKLGVKVKGLITIDSPYPVNHDPLPQSVINYVTRSAPADSALAQEFQRNASLLGSYQPKPFGNDEQIKVVTLRSRDVFDTEQLCGVRYDWLSKQSTREEAITAWEGLVGKKIETLPIPGNHFEPFVSKNIKDTSSQIWKACSLVTS